MGIINLLPFGKGTVNYGVKIELSGAISNDPTDAVTYIGDAVGMEGGSSEWFKKFPFNQIYPVMLKDGKENYKLDKNDLGKKENGDMANISSGADGDVMVRFPAIYISLKNFGTHIEIYISNEKIDESYECFQNIKDGIVKKDLYIASYIGSSLDNVMKSLINARAYFSGSGIENAAGFNGDGYNILSFYSHFMLKVLFLIFFKSRDFLKLGYYRTVANGTLNKGGANEGLTGIKFLWIENFYGIQQLLSGIYIKTNDVFVCKDNKILNFSNSPTWAKIAYRLTMSPKDGYIYTVRADKTESGLLPFQFSGTSSSDLRYKDYVNLNGVENATYFHRVFVGGAATISNNYLHVFGMRIFNTNTVNSGSYYSRLMFI